MTTPSVGVERRVGQRFTFNLPVALREVSNSAEGLGFTQDVSSRGAFFFTDMALREGTEIELTLIMPSQITLGDNMRVRCRGRILRIIAPPGKKWSPALVSSEKAPEIRNETKIENGTTDTKIGVAVCLECYEYLPDTEESSADFRRISALHSHSEAERTVPPVAAVPRVSVT